MVCSHSTATPTSTAFAATSATAAAGGATIATSAATPATLADMMRVGVIGGSDFDGAGFLRICLHGFALLFSVTYDRYDFIISYYLKITISMVE